MAYDLEEQEQIATIKAWWAQYGRLVIVTLVGSLVAIAAVRGWHYYRGSQATSAAVLFEQQQRAEQASDHKKVLGIAAQIIETYGATPYAATAALAAAKSAFDTGDVAAAKTRLQWVIDNAKEEESRDLARLRLARVLFDEKNPAEALKLLDTKPGEPFVGLYAGLKGDVLAVQGKRQEARTAYQLALEKSDPASPLRQIIQLKLDALGVAK